MTGMEPFFFPTPANWRAWLEKNHETGRELWVGFYKKGSGKPSITWPESVDQALCFGWIDGIRRSLDADAYLIRFTPRKPTSTWSAVNTRRVAELERLDLMRPAGLQAYSHWKSHNSGIYSFEQPRPAKLSRSHQAQLRASPKAWTFFSTQPPWYQRAAAWWVSSAKREETRLKRLSTLIADSERGRTIAPLTRKKS